MLLRRGGDTVSPNCWRLLAFLIVIVCLSCARAIAKPSADVGKGSVTDHRLKIKEEDGRKPQWQQQQQQQQHDKLQQQGSISLEKRSSREEFAKREAVDDGGRGSLVGQDEEEDGLTVAPKYMLELYRKFSNDKYSHPIANIVRSFLNINTGVAPIWTNGNNTRIALHTLLFDISSINHDEEIYLAELRLFAAKKTQRVLVYEVVHPLPSNQDEKTPPPRRYQLLTSREIPRGHGDWETFSVTDVIRRWVRTQATAGHILEVRVDTARPSDAGGEEKAETEVDAETGKKDGVGNSSSSYDPILVVFSNDRKRHKIELRELHEIQSHENEVRGEEAAGNGNGNFSPSPSFPSAFPSSSEEEEDGEYYDADADDDNDAVWSDDDQENNRFNSSLGGAEEEKTYPRLLESLSGQEATSGADRKLSRVKRNLNKKRGRRARRNSCRRKPMYVNFRDVQWEKWIIEPAGYQAYECTGQCYFPLAEHLTPTKYAMVKSLLHATYPKKTSAVCCVPTRLEPISLLYVDEHGIVTYKYKYDGMVVAECGCR